VKKNGGGNQMTALLVTLWDAKQGVAVSALCECGIEGRIESKALPCKVWTVQTGVGRLLYPFFIAISVT
jgi:hypothetical protein